MSIELKTKERYAKAAEARELELCCPVSYDPRFLKVIPDEILERDYGCGDPSVYLEPGDTVLDLGSGGGKICYIASQVVGKEGKVIGVDFNEPMLALANKYREEMAEKIGYGNVEFRKGRIQDLKLDLSQTEEYLNRNHISDLESLYRLQDFQEDQKAQNPLVASDSIDVIVSNCVLNLVEQSQKKNLFQEMYRVLKRGGRAVISDIVSDELVPQEMQDDPELWSGCISGAYQESAFLKAFEEAGFYGVEILKRDETPWKVVEGIEFRSLTVRAWKGKEGPCMDHQQAVIYKGPWKRVVDDDGHTLERGELMAVCEKTFDIYSQNPYKEDIIPVQPRSPVSKEDAKPYDCRRNAKRDPRELKNADYLENDNTSTSCCDPASGCC